VVNLSSPFVPLRCKTAFSFLEGASSAEELFEEAARLGIGSLAVTDRDGVQGIVQAHLAAKETGVRLVVGSEVTVTGGATIVLLAADRRGYANLCRLATKGRLRSPKGTSEVTWDEVSSHAPGLVALWHGPGEDALPALADAFGGSLFAAVARHRAAGERRAERRLRAAAARLALPVVAANEVLYHVPARRDLQDVLTCIRRGVTLDTAGRLLKPNDCHALLAPAEFAELFADDPDAVRRTLEVAERCTFSMSDLRYRYPSERLPDGTTSSQWLRRLAFDGAARIYGATPDDVGAQLAKELGVIDALGYPGYFLTMHEIVRFCRERGILCQGRGSAANSAVCWTLGITAVDPVRSGLLFERFLSMERAEPPDIDLDIEHGRREEVIQHVYAKYGRDRAAMVANVVRWRPRSAVRDVGKALGLTETSLGRMAQLTSHCDSVTPAVVADAGLDPGAPLHRHLVRLVNEIQGLPRHLSIHPGGFLLGEGPVTDLVPVENAAMEDRTVIQWDKDDVEALGLFKVDLLGLGTLTHIHRCLDLVNASHGTDLSLATIPSEDAATYEMIRRADTVGVFQIESRAQMAMLPRLAPRTFYDLVIEVAIVRPGPISGGMVHPYLRRRAGEETPDFPHECLRPVLAKTLGVPLFQEQVMRLAVVAADYTPGEADQLRRDMAAWRKSGRIDHHRERLVTRMTARGIAPEFAERVFQQIRGFGEYGFPESHAASFALLAYATAWLRRHHPAEFTCALLDSLPMGFYSAATIVDDAKRHGIEVRPVDAAVSGWDCTTEGRIHHGGTEARRREREVPSSSPCLLPGIRCSRPRLPSVVAASVSPCLRGESSPCAVRIGLKFVKGLTAADGERIVATRRERAFASVDDFRDRTRLDRRALPRLAEAGALESLGGPSRRGDLWSVLAPPAPEGGGLPLGLAEAPAAFAPLGASDTISWDYRTTHMSPRGHPLEPLRGALRAERLPDAREVALLPHGSRVRYAGIVICRQRPGTASGVLFMTLEDETGFVNLVVWSRVFEAHGVLVRTSHFLGVTGKVQNEKGVVHVVAESFWTPRIAALPPHGGSHDFR
jgi:error-prone DNA polymerase